MAMMINSQIIEGEAVIEEVEVEAEEVRDTEVIEVVEEVDEYQ